MRPPVAGRALPPTNQLGVAGADVVEAILGEFAAAVLGQHVSVRLEAPAAGGHVVVIVGTAGDGPAALAAGRSCAER